jgi:hypothetical protein
MSTPGGAPAIIVLVQLALLRLLVQLNLVQPMRLALRQLRMPMRRLVPKLLPRNPRAHLLSAIWGRPRAPAQLRLLRERGR